MVEKNKFDWVNFYREFALKLLNYKNNRPELIEKVKEIFIKSEISMPTLERDNNLVDIDPFTVFGIFNKNIREENRRKIVKAVAELFEIKTATPESFDSLPVLNPLSSTFCNFIDERDDKDIDDLWGLFESALDYANNPSEENKERVSHYFDLAINKRGNGNSKITMGLYWIAPDSFLNLDSRNEWYIYKSGKIPESVVGELPPTESKISSEKYFLIMKKMKKYLQSSDSKLNDFKELSFAAWKYSNQVNKENREKESESSNSVPEDDSDAVNRLNSTVKEETDKDVEEEETAYPEYTREDFLSEVYMSEKEYDNLVNLLCRKKNIILQGAPGVGKTYLAKRLAFSMMGVRDIERVMMVQFHQSYSYEDFIMGFRPYADGFELKRGAFYNFCKKAELDMENDYFFIIDEINRGNLSKIFGELMMLIESDKRGVSLQLLYSDEKFSVPDNVYIIGMMNTADRSLAILDYALRRRFAFFEIEPGFTTEGFRKYSMSLENEKFNALITCVMNLNNVITEDESLGEGFCIGHSYFCNLSADEINDRILTGIVEYELIPLLKEYWFDDTLKVSDWSNRLRSAIK